MSTIKSDTDFTWDCFHSGKHLLEYLHAAQETYQIYILDIEMPECSGIDTARLIRENDKNALIIFLTDFKEYVYQVFEALPFRFLQKPLQQNILERTLREAICHIRKFGALFFFQIGRESMQRPLGEILYFESAGRKIILHMKSETHTFYGKITEIWPQLDKQLFTRPHASFLVNGMI